jgi:hypothetical protein
MQCGLVHSLWFLKRFCPQTPILRKVFMTWISLARKIFLRYNFALYFPKEEVAPLSL